MPAYLFVNCTISDPVRFREYAVANAALVAKMGGKYLVLGSEGEALEGAALIGKKVISEGPPSKQRLPTGTHRNMPRFANCAKTFVTHKS